MPAPYYECSYDHKNRNYDYQSLNNHDLIHNKIFF